MHYKLWIHEDCWLLNLYDDILPLSYCFYCLQQEKFEQSFSALQNTAFQWQMMQPLHLSLQLWQMGLHKLLMAQPHPRDCNLHKASEQPVSYSMGAWNKITVMLIADNLSHTQDRTFNFEQHFKHKKLFLPKCFLRWWNIGSGLRSKPQGNGFKHLNR